MNKVALNFICKNEGHIIGRMLNSVKPLIDMIVAVDTGSSDKTMDIIREFGTAQGIPTYVFQRPFDNFCNSRNYAMQQLKEIAGNNCWDLSRSWGFTIDCDEWAKFDQTFKKEDLIADFYVVRQRIGRETFTRHGLFRLSKDISWESPVHETLVYNDPAIMKKYEFKIEVIEEPLGASWKGDLVQKFLRYADVLKAYKDEGNNNFRTVFFIGDSYHAAASYCKNEKTAMDLYRMAGEFFEQACSLEVNSPEVRFMLHKKIAENKQAMNCSWPFVQAEFLQAFLEHPAKAETIALIIEKYIDREQWELVYYFSRFSLRHFVERPQQNQRVLYNDESLYQWRLLFCCYYTAFQSGRRREARRLFHQLKKLEALHPEYFTSEDEMLIHLHSPLILTVNNWKEKVGRYLSSLRNRGSVDNQFGSFSTEQAHKKIHYAA